jgi:1,2-phenylacetyl-CoA epoxidase PaaB subunit
MAVVPSCRIYHYEEEGMSFKMTFTLHARKVEEWIKVIQEKFLDNTPIMCVWLDIEYTKAVPYVK